MRAPIKSIIRVEDILSWIKRDFPGVVLSPVPYLIGHTPRGTPFVTLCSGGIKREGDPAPVLCLDAKLAEVYYQDSLKQYIEANGPGVLCWRQLPTMETVLTHGVDRYFVWSRLCVEKEVTHEDK